MVTQYLVVDGHSVIHAWPELRGIHARQPRLARESLIRELRTLHDASHWAVTLIFDGRRGTSEAPDQAGFIVRYSKADQTADSLIEALVAGQPEKDRDRITVITADQAERHTVESLGALCFSPDWLRLEIEQQIKAFTQIQYGVKRQARW
jgi:predicted RNA-binding protein with PIN domain